MPSSKPVSEHIRHSVTKVIELSAHETGEPRTLFQLGYNLGRLSELTGLGREPFWDRWKEPVLAWDHARLLTLAQELHHELLAGQDEPAARELTETERVG